MQTKEYTLETFKKEMLDAECRRFAVADEILKRMTANIRDFSLVPGNTLIFLDEIQRCGNARTAIKFLAEDMRFDVISSGSLMGLTYGEDDDDDVEVPESIPVGYESQITMYSLDFEEFLWAYGYNDKSINILRSYYETGETIPEVIHNKYESLFREFMVVGGMPEAVSRYVETRDLSQISTVYANLLTAYKDDVSKYASSAHEGDVIRHVIETAPKESGNRIAFEKFGNSGYRSLDVGNSMRKLERAMLLYLRYPITQTELPLYPDKKLRPRLQVLDSGLINYSLGIQAMYFQETQLTDIYRGTLA